MRGMIKILSITADGKSGDFRLMKQNAFSRSIPAADAVRNAEEIRRGSLARGQGPGPCHVRAKETHPMGRGAVTVAPAVRILRPAE